MNNSASSESNSNPNPSKDGPAASDGVKNASAKRNGSRRGKNQARSRSGPNQRRPHQRHRGSAAEAKSQATQFDGDIESEFGVPFAGKILPPEQWAKTALKRLPSAGVIDFAQLFGREAPRVLDIGCGNGRFLLSSAVRRPEMDHIGIDALPMVIRYATRRANVRGLNNCRLAVCDGARFLNEFCAESSLQEIHVYHPQPFPDKSEQHLRLFQHEFLWLIHQALATDGKLCVQTDNLAYWTYLQAVLPSITQWHTQPGPWPEDPQGRSRREIVALHKGLSIYRGWGLRLNDLTRSEFEKRVNGLPQPDFNAQHNRNPNQWRR